MVNYDSYSTLNLQYNSSFSTRISKDLFWVPFNKLGYTRYKNGELYKLYKTCSSTEMQKLGLNLYEALQLFQTIDFKERDDIVIYQYDNIPWQLHKSGKYAFESNEGYCASAAAWLNYILYDSYQAKGYLHYMRPNGSGHLMNYIYYDGLYFIIDMMTQTYENSKFIAKETGLLTDYLSAKYHTGICFCTNNLMNFIYYHSRIQMIKGYKFSYLLLEPYKALPPCYVEFKEGNLMFHYVGDTNIVLGDIITVKHEKFILSREYMKYTNEY